MKRRTERRRWRDLWWEALIGLLVVWALLWLAWYGPARLQSSISGAIFGRRAIAMALVAVMAAVIAQMYWPLRRSLVFWGMSAAFLCILGASAYTWFPNGATGGVPRAIWFGAIGGAEFAPYAYLVYRKFHVLPKQRR